MNRRGVYVSVAHSDFNQNPAFEFLALDFWHQAVQSANMIAVKPAKLKQAGES